MESIPPENLKALEDMNWEDRLEKARAQRKAILEARSSAGEVENHQAVIKPIVSSVAMVEKLRFGTSDEAVPAAVGPVVAARSVPKRLAYLGAGLCVGIGIGIAITVYPGQPPSGESLAMERGAEVAPGRDAASETVAAGTEPAARGATVPEKRPPRDEGPLVLTELGAEVSSPPFADPPNVPGVSVAAAREPVTLAELGAPALGAPPAVGVPPVAPATARPPAASAPVLQDTAETPMFSSLDRVETDAGSIELVAGNRFFSAPSETGAYLREVNPLPVIPGPVSVLGRLSTADPERPQHLGSVTAAPAAAATDLGAEIELASFDDDPLALREPDSLARAPTAAASPDADSVPPAPVIRGAENTVIWIFAASSVDDDMLESAQNLVEGLELPVRAVERVGYRISEHQVRFYDAATAAAATRLANEIGAVARDFTDSDFDPSPGTLEIYLAGEAAETAPPRPAVARAPAPARRSQLSEAERLRNSVISRLRGGVPR